MGSQRRANEREVVLLATACVDVERNCDFHFVVWYCAFFFTTHDLFRLLFIIISFLPCLCPKPPRQYDTDQDNNSID